ICSIFPDWPFSSWEALALSVPRSIEFTYFRVGPYMMFKTEKVESAEIKIVETKQLPDGGYVALAQAARSSEAQRWMKFKTAAVFEVECEGETLRERYQRCETSIYDRAMQVFAVRKFGELPEKLKGNYTFFFLDREDDGKDEMTAKVMVFVGFLGSGKLEPEEKGMVLMNAWRNAVARGAGGLGAAIYKQAIKAYPNATYAKEFGLYEFSQNRLDNAIMAINDAIKIAPYEVEYLKILYQIYKKKNDQGKMDELQKKLQELESWDENPGEDITGAFQYKSKITWTERGDEKTPSGIIQFREMDSAEQENLKATVKEE
ncbi:MAG: hypothetical protein C4523_11885, partial [Myxococcales bacterium]